MKIQIVSDLHVDVNGVPDPQDFACDADLMIVAGDVGPAPSVMPVLKHISGHARHGVAYVMGNHEAYGLDAPIDEVASYLREEAVKYEVTLLGAFIYGPLAIDLDILLVGATLWTDFKLNDSFRNRRQQYYMAVARDGMNDYRKIKDLTPEWTANISNRESAAMGNLLRELRETGSTLVGVSHHLPTAQSLDPKYARSPLNPAFASNYDHLLEGCRLWVHGHTHASLDYIHEKSGCRVVCNPKGYGDENPAFNPKLVVEV